MDLDPERCYRAMLARDTRYDGRFFTGVVTTGVYCRPVCPVSPPKQKNVRFFACAAAAETAGFRPCKRCRPETAPGTPAWAGTSAVVSRALRLIADGGLDANLDSNAEAFASRLGLGERQLRRLFVQHLGASPAEVARARRVHFARTLLDQTDLPVAEVAHAAGFASLRQFNHSVKGTFGRTPTEMRAARDDGADACASSGSIAVKLPYRPPLAWEAMLGFLAERAIPGVEVVRDGAWTRSIEIGGRRGILEVSKPEADRRDRQPHRAPCLLVRVEAPLCENLIAVAERVRRVFDLDADPGAVLSHFAACPVLGPLVAAVPGLRVPGAWDPFELAVRAILGQQVTVRGATTLAGRIVQRYGAPLASAREGLTHLFPRPEVLAEADFDGIGLVRARADAIRAMASAVACGRLVLDSPLGLDDAMARLEALPGFGPWTAAYVAMRAFGEPDAFPDGDLGLRKAVGRSGAAVPARELRSTAERWRTWRATAAMYLWTAAHAAAESPARLEKAS